MYGAILRDDLDGLRAALKAPEVDLAVCLGQTPLTLASHRNRPEMVSLLLESGVDGDQPNGESNTALACASFHGYTEVVEILLRHGVDLHKANRWNGTPLGLARMQGHEEIVALLEAAGATQ